MIATVVPPGRDDPAILASEVALLRLGNRVLIPRVTLIDGITERIAFDEHVPRFPVLVERASQQNSHAEIDLYQIRRDQFAIDDDTWGDKHLLSPLGHITILEGGIFRILEAPPATQQDSAVSHFLVPGQRLVEKIKQVIVHR